jgi:hypothetical protein
MSTEAYRDATRRDKMTIPALGNALRPKMAASDSVLAREKIDHRPENLSIRRFRDNFKLRIRKKAIVSERLSVGHLDPRQYPHVGPKQNLFIFIFLGAGNIRRLWLSSNTLHVILEFQGRRFQSYSRVAIGSRSSLELAEKDVKVR